MVRNWLCASRSSSLSDRWRLPYWLAWHYTLISNSLLGLTLLVLVATMQTQVSSNFIGWLFCYITSQQQISVSQGRIYLDKFTCRHTVTNFADKICHLAQSQPPRPSSTRKAKRVTGKPLQYQFHANGRTQPGYEPAPPALERRGGQVQIVQIIPASPYDCKEQRDPD